MKINYTQSTRSETEYNRWLNDKAEPIERQIDVDEFEVIGWRTNADLIADAIDCEMEEFVSIGGRSMGSFF